MSTDNKRPIRHVKQLDPLSADIISAPTKELEERIRILENALANISRKGTITNVIIERRPVRSDVGLYSAVYFNPASGLFEKAQARVEFSGTTFNTLNTSLVVGIVVKLVGTTADILVDGSWPAAVFKAGSTNLLEPGETFQPGRPYYLSSDHAGRITIRPPALAVQVLMTTDDAILMNKVYGSPDGFEKSAKFKMGMRPVGGLTSVGNDSRLVGFDGLEADTESGDWSRITDNVKFSDSGFIVADSEAIGLIDVELWLEILINKSGHVTLNTASSLAQLGSPNIRSEEFTSTSQVTSDEPFAISTINYSDVRTYVVRDENNTAVQRIKFKFVCNHGESFDTDSFRSVIFKLPDSFMGWKEINSSPVVSGESSGKYQITPYYAEDAPCDYPDYPNVPVDSALYYATRADFGFVQNWPAEPVGKAIVMLNGVEMSTSELVPNGLSSYFGDSKFDMGASTKTLYWPTSYAEAVPWGLTYDKLAKKADGSYNTTAAISHRSAGAGYAWCWQEDLYDFEPLLNKGWVYTNKLSVYSKSSKVLGLGVMPPLRVKDMITGLEPSYTGEPISGNLLVWSEDRDNVLSKVQDLDLGRFDTKILYTNDTKFNVAVKDITFVVRSQNNSQRSNSELGQIFTEEDYALVDVGTGTEGLSVYNIIQREPVRVMEYNRSCVLNLSENATVVPPNGVVRIVVYKPFDVEQTVSVIFSGRTI